MQLQTERLIIRPYDPERDAAAAFEIYSDEEVVRYLGGPGKTMPSVEAQRDALRKRNEKIADAKNGMGFWAIEVRATGEIVGSVLLMPLGDGKGVIFHEWEIGWHLKRTRWGCGYATEAARAVARYGFETLKLPLIRAVAFKENGASIRVMGRLGMRSVGPTSKYFGLELECYELTPPELVSSDARAT